MDYGSACISLMVTKGVGIAYSIAFVTVHIKDRPPARANSSFCFCANFKMQLL
jgi:hypothetical protein